LPFARIWYVYLTLMLDLTIAIPVKNEELNLPGCLKAIGPNLARQIVVIDSGSSDKTVELAKKHGAEVVHFEWNGKFPKKRNWFLRNYPLTTKWILFLDADEYLTYEFKSELRRKLKEDKNIGFWLSYTIYFMGKKLKGGYPLKKLALFQVGAGEYERIDEDRWSQLDMEVHEHPHLKGRVGKFSNKIDHQDFRGVTHYMTKHNEYANWEAERFLNNFNDFGKQNGWTWKQKLKYRLLNTPLIGPIYFLGSFLFLGGWKDGKKGFAFALLKMGYFTQIYCKIQESKNNLV
jgi:glycosyltransferase involved in cell wall biosynthesis